MGRIFVVELEGRSYRCRFCDSPLALANDVLSRRKGRWMLNHKTANRRKHHTRTRACSWESFNCRKGRAYLFNNVVNVTNGAQEERLMLSGMHTVEDIFCCCCGQILGWKYISAHDKNHKYKEGKFVLERWRITEEMMMEEFSLEGQPGSSDAENS